MPTSLLHYAVVRARIDVTLRRCDCGATDRPSAPGAHNRHLSVLFVVADVFSRVRPINGRTAEFAGQC